MEKLQDIELTIKDLQKDGVFAISLVESPAIEENFVHLNSETIELKVVDEEKKIVVGYALIPDKKILRRVKDKEFNIYFSAETVRQSAELYMSNLKQNSVTVNHERNITDAGVIESWITEDEKHDKINLYGIKPIVGGWAVMMKINNDKEWEAVKKGEYKGFSIEAKYEGFDQLKQSKMDKLEGIKKIISEGLELKSENVNLGLIDTYKSALSFYGDLDFNSEIALTKKYEQDFQKIQGEIISGLSVIEKKYNRNKNSIIALTDLQEKFLQVEKITGDKTQESINLDKLIKKIRKESDELQYNFTKVAKFSMGLSSMDLIKY